MGENCMEKYLECNTGVIEMMKLVSSIDDLLLQYVQNLFMCL